MSTYGNILPFISVDPDSGLCVKFAANGEIVVDGQLVATVKPGQPHEIALHYWNLRSGDRRRCFILNKNGSEVSPDEIGAGLPIPQGFGIFISDRKPAEAKSDIPVLRVFQLPTTDYSVQHQ
jgi:hypothetical protein